MEAVEFVSAIRQRVIENDFLAYVEQLSTIDDAKDPIWKEILKLYRGMTKEQQESFLKFVKLIQVNSVSHFLGILDGSTYLNEKRENFILTTKSQIEIINGDLQDIFLEMEGA